MRYYGDPVLRKQAKTVEKFDSKLQAFIDELIETMRSEDGVGLAAPQVGESIRVVVIDASGGEMEPYVLVNPQIVQFSEEKEDYDEGCLSIPGVTLSVNRPSKITVKACNGSGEEYTIEDAEGLLARALQHEIDHLNGILFIDHVSPLQRSLISGKLKKISKAKRDKSETI
ncbi:peptide deformylase [Chitinispirillales bacterium ANBcel5]|uniref:peptide deformylase n=1 Tax=Cellulosispirillum alkaliphilum TaxID=3039283 RepID=UPI002A504F95|nr:peptide deformylase [Chitinispirillales bacterium ANBcel5]